MKKGKWNYTEDIEYTVMLVKLLHVPGTPMHWQNTHVGEYRQVVKIKDKTGYEFLIDNTDGSGLFKISRGGGPDSYSAHVSGYEFIKELPEEEWQHWSPDLHKKIRQERDAWQLKNFPEEYEKLKRLREMIVNKSFK